MNGKSYNINGKLGMNGVRKPSWNGQLYDAGNEYTWKTGGWVLSSTPTYDRAIYTKNASNIYLLFDATPGSVGYSFCKTINSFDLTNYTKMKVTLNVTEFAGTERNVGMFCGTTVIGSIPLSSLGERTVEIDITSQNISGTITVYCQAANSSYLGFTISKIWLE